MSKASEYAKAAATRPPEFNPSKDLPYWRAKVSLGGGLEFNRDYPNIDSKDVLAFIKWLKENFLE